MKHKHCEVIKAWADGKQIQWFDDLIRDEWIDIDRPIWADENKYRVKPETVTYWVALLENGNTISSTSELHACSIAGLPSFVKWLIEGNEVEV